MDDRRAYIVVPEIEANEFREVAQTRHVATNGDAFVRHCVHFDTLCWNRKSLIGC